MAINFPDNPSTNDFFTASSGVVYQFDGIKWTVTSGGPTSDLEVNSLGVGTAASGVTGEVTTSVALDADTLEGNNSEHFTDESIRFAVALG